MILNSAHYGCVIFWGGGGEGNHPPFEIYSVALIYAILPSKVILPPLERILNATLLNEDVCHKYTHPVQL
jgi:hypothetical protein